MPVGLQWRQTGHVRPACPVLHRLCRLCRPMSYYVLWSMYYGRTSAPPVPRPMPLGSLVEPPQSGDPDPVCCAQQNDRTSMVPGVDRVVVLGPGPADPSILGLFFHAPPTAKRLTETSSGSGCRIQSSCRLSSTPKDLSLPGQA